MKINQDLKMFNRQLYYPVAYDEKSVTYVKVSDKDALIVVNGNTDLVKDVEKIISGKNAEVIAHSNIQKIADYMLNDEHVIIIRKYVGS